ncbi:unnamed protein product [Blepharisma stoltei]|uniref:TPX2 central domain-containing protein n=1 Tax=Blepharisma stoltei TaxID=1481888 RepID=A0AAU9K4R9_9CILI|nr:unnamed protein product [Blepharisma stoltei]
MLTPNMEDQILSSAVFHKRKFSPLPESDFGDTKRSKKVKFVDEKEKASKNEMPNSSAFSDMLNLSNTTVPVPFVFRTELRSKLSTKAADIKSEENLALRPKFKARKIPKSVYYPKILKISSDKPLTQPVSLRFHLDSRAGRHKPAEKEDMAHIQEFKALPLNKKILEKPDFQYKKSEIKTTVPKEFNFETAKRAKIYGEFEQSESKTDKSFDSSSFLVAKVSAKLSNSFSFHNCEKIEIANPDESNKENECLGQELTAIRSCRDAIKNIGFENLVSKENEIN